MSNGSDTHLQSIDRATLTPLVRQALSSDTVVVTSWDTDLVYGGASYGSAGGSAIHRVSGSGQDEHETLDWSLILKVLHPPADRGQPSDWDYWRREADAYDSGFLDDLPGGLAAPRCYGVVDQPNGECWIWMEEVADNIGSADDIVGTDAGAGKDAGAKWPLEHYGVVARHLGQFNGAYLTGRPLPSFPWLSLRRLRQRVAQAAPAMAQLTGAQDHPLVRRAYPPDVVDTLLRRWAEREQFLDMLDRLPQTLCHFDAFPRNLFTRRTAGGGEQIVAIDWASVGIGGIGEELTGIVSNTLLWGGVDPAQVKELDDVTFEGYLEGLYDAGWQGDTRPVRFGQTVPLITNVTAVAYLLPILLDESRHAWWEQTYGLPMAEFADHWAERSRHHPLGYWEHEARELLLEL